MTTQTTIDAVRPFSDYTPSELHALLAQAEQVYWSRHFSPDGRADALLRLEFLGHWLYDHFHPGARSVDAALAEAV
jgi:hypothetical protein